MRFWPNGVYVTSVAVMPSFRSTKNRTDRSIYIQERNKIPYPKNEDLIDQMS